MVQSSEREQQHLDFFPIFLDTTRRYSKELPRSWQMKEMNQDQKETGLVIQRQVILKVRMTVTVTFIYLSIAGFLDKSLFILFPQGIRPLYSLYFIISFISFHLSFYPPLPSSNQGRLQ